MLEKRNVQTINEFEFKFENRCELISCFNPSDENRTVISTPMQILLSFYFGSKIHLFTSIWLGILICCKTEIPLETFKRMHC